MREKVTILKVDGRILTVRCSAVDQCASCAGRGFCSAPKERQFNAVNRYGLPLRPGQQVEIVLPAGKTIGAAFMVLILPLVLFCVLFIAGGRLFGIVHEGEKALLGLSGLAAGFGLSLLLNRNRKERNMPYVDRPEPEEP